MNHGRSIRNPFVLIVFLCLIVFFRLPNASAAENTAETTADALKRAVTLADMPPGYQQMGPIRTRDFSSFSEATADFGPQRSLTSLIQVILKQYKSNAEAEKDFNNYVQFLLKKSENVLGRNFGLGSGSIHTGDRRYLDSKHTRYEMVNQSIEVIQRNWLVKIHILNYNQLRSRDFSDADAGKIIRTIAATALGRLSGRASEAEGPDCGKAGALTGYLEALRTHNHNMNVLDNDLQRMLSGPDPDPQTIIAIGRKAEQIGSEYHKTLKDFQRAETRRGLFEELNLLVETPILLNRVVVKYQKLARVQLTPLNPNALNQSKADVLRTLLALARKECAGRLESEGLRDILTSASWEEALDKTAFHAQRKANEFLDRETERIFGFGFHDAQSAQRALQLHMRREIRRQVAKLLVKITSNELIIEFAAGPIIRWIERDLLPRLAEALRQKGNLPERVTRSVETLNNARDALNRLACDARLREVRRLLDMATGALHATRFLDRDLRNANAGAELARLDGARNNLARTMTITQNRFLLVKDDYEEDLVFINNLVEEMLNNLKQSIPSEGAIRPPIISQAKWEKMRDEVARQAPYADTPSIAELMKEGYMGVVVAGSGDYSLYEYSGRQMRASRPRRVNSGAVDTQLLRIGDTIQTGKDGRLKLQLFDGDKTRGTNPSVIYVGTNSEIRLDRFFGPHSARESKMESLFSLITGIVRGVFKGLRGASSLTIRCTGVVCTIRGSDVLIAYDPNTERTDAYVIEGHMDVTNAKTGETRSLVHNQKLIVSKDDIGAIQPLSRTEWDSLIKGTGVKDMEPSGRQTTVDTKAPVDDIPELKAVVTDVKFFEGDVNGVPYGQREYRKHFARADSRYIWWELNLKHPALGRRVDFDIDAVWYGTDGSEFARQTRNTFLEGTWMNSVHLFGRGWNDPGHWKPGVYRVELFHRGKKIAGNTFEIVDQVRQGYDIPSIQANVASVKFYEGGYDAIPYDQRVYNVWFPRSSSRTIWWELNLEHSAPGRRIDFFVEAVFYRPDRSILARQTNNTGIQPAWTTSYHSLGWGWREAGNWEPGTYRVELFVDGKKVDSGTFQITGQ